MIKVAVIIPCYNEAGNIKNVIEGLRAIVLPDIIIDPVVINDCSKDDTLNVVKSLGCKYIDLPINLGIGGAIQTGFKFAHIK